MNTNRHQVRTLDERIRDLVARSDYDDARWPFGTAEYAFQLWLHFGTWTTAN